MLSFGPYPAMPLAVAREKRNEAKRLLLSGTDPSVQKKVDSIAAEKAAQNTFGALAAEHLENLAATGTAETTMTKNRWMLQVPSAPLTRRPIAQIAPIEVLDVLKRIEKSGRRETARKLRGAIGSVFRYAIVTLRATYDPTAPLRGALLKPNVQHRPAITDEGRLGMLMCSIDACLSG
jgi:integrase